MGYALETIPENQQIGGTDTCIRIFSVVLRSCNFATSPKVITKQNINLKRVDIHVNVKKGSIRSLTINFPFNGNIDRFVDENAQKYGITTAYALPSFASVIYRKEDHKAIRFSENLDLTIEHPMPETELRYIIYYADSYYQNKFRPDFKINLKGDNKGFLFKELYVIEYQWERDKQLFNESEVRLVKDDTELMVNGKKVKATDLPRIYESFIQTEGSDSVIAKREVAPLLSKRRLQ
jgi:hypothetical protein